MGIDWAAEEMRYLRLKDQRLVARTKAVIGMLSEQPAKSVPEASQNWAETKGVYRMWSNQKVSEEAIRQAHYQATRDRVVKERRILAIQDTTELNFTGKNVGEALGMLSHKQARGVLMHSVLIASEQGVPLGLVHQYLWTRDPQSVGISDERHKRKTEEKESQRWLDGVQATEALLGEEVEIVHIADREADLYDLFSLPRQAGSELLIRVHQNRRVEHEADYLWEAVRQAPVAGERIVQVSKQANRQPRSATCQVRFATVSVLGPGKLSTVPLQFVLVEEQNAAQESEPIEWLLATTLPITALAAAFQCIDYYCLRWLIERFHYVLKSGCRVEHLYLQTPDRLLRALAVYSIVAWRILWLTYAARQNPDQPCDTILQTHEWQALYCTLHQKTIPPTNPPTIQQAVLWIAKLGGFLGRSRDGFPGPKTIWQGLRRLDDIAATWLLLNPAYPE